MALQDQLVKFFAERLQVEVPSHDTDLIETGLIDSLGFVELLLHLEEEYGVRVSLDEVELDSFRTVERIAAFLGQARRAKHTRMTSAPRSAESDPSS